MAIMSVVPMNVPIAIGANSCVPLAPMAIAIGDHWSIGSIIVGPMVMDPQDGDTLFTITTQTDCHHCCHCKCTTNSITILWLAPLSPIIMYESPLSPMEFMAQLSPLNHHWLHCRHWHHCRYNWRHWNFKSSIHSELCVVIVNGASLHRAVSLVHYYGSNGRQWRLGPQLAPLTSLHWRQWNIHLLHWSDPLMAAIAPLTKLYDPFAQNSYVSSGSAALTNEKLGRPINST